MMRVCAVFLGLNQVPLLFRPGWRFESQGIHGFTPSFRSNVRVALDHPPAAPSKTESLGSTCFVHVATGRVRKSCQLHLPFAVF